MLEQVKVVEVSHPATMLAGQILAELGADVIVVEPPGGGAGRRLPPFLDDRPGIERSLAWHALNRNKRAMTLDVGCDDGQAILRQMLSRADILIEASMAPATRGPMAATEGLVHCVVRPFSARGPKSGHAQTDRTISAASGVPAYTGDGDRPPLFFPVPQAMMEAGAEAAVAALAGLAARTRDAQGQQVDVSMRTAAMMSALSLPYFHQAGDTHPLRGARIRPVLGVTPPQFLRCADGFVQVSIAFGGFGAVTGRLAKWLVEGGHAPQAVAETDWSAFPGDDEDVSRARLVDLIDGLVRAVAPLARKEIGEAARVHGFFVAPLLDMGDIASFEQYAARGLWVPQRLPDGREIPVPARFAQFTPPFEPTRQPAPALSGHTHEILVEAGYSDTEIQALFCHGII